MQGQGDFPLSECGLEQATRLAARLSRENSLTALYASPLLRTRQTAEVVSQAVALPVYTLEDVREYDFGEASGLTWTEIAQRYPDLIAAVRARTPEYPRYPGEEGREVFRRRVCGAVWSLCATHGDGSTVAIVTHAGPIVVTCLEVLGLAYQRPAPFAVDNCSITAVELRETSGILLYTNDTCHL